MPEGAPERAPGAMEGAKLGHPIACGAIEVREELRGS
jgi:hypothetical protein